MKKLISIIITSAMLTACGGGGEAGKGQTSTPSLPKPPTNYYGLTPKTQGSTLLVGDKKIDLAAEPQGMRVHTLYNKQTVEFYNQRYSAFGYVMPRTANSNRVNELMRLSVDMNDALLYSSDLKFENLPKTGIATYAGISYAPNSKGKLELVADFGEKKVFGRIYDQVAQYGTKHPEDILLLKTDIQKNMTKDYEIHFIGPAITTKERFGYGGLFAGPQADEVVGVVVSDKNTIKTGFIGKKAN